MEKDEEIKALKKELEHYKSLAEGKEFISVIFVTEDKKILYSIVCKEGDKVNTAEDKLTIKYPELKDEDDISYYVNGKKLKGKKSFKDNKISNGDVITLKYGDN